MVAGTYGKKIAITPDAGLVIDRSLNAQRFNAATTYTPPPWPQLVEMMHRYEASRNV
jgi:dTDP-4-dehydrorhamnose reductase